MSKQMRRGASPSETKFARNGLLVHHTITLLSPSHQDRAGYSTMDDRDPTCDQQSMPTYGLRLRRLSAQLAT
jgi:hypothetical protein